jgi:large subunit ribosomal protein L15
MKLNTLKPAEGSVKNRKRIGRGEGSGHGGTSTRGHKGAGSRSGNKRKIGFEGGQMPLQRRVPKFGFKNINRVEYKAINLDMIENLASVKGILDITPEIMRENGLLSNNELVKILGRGDLKAKVNISANGFSTTAIAAIEALGGTCTKI